MRTLYVTEFITLDGVIDSPGGDEGHPHAGWSFKDVDFLPEAYEMKGQEQEEAGALMLGRVSYDLFAPVWPSMTAEFPRYNAMPKYVVSSTLQEKDLVDNWGEIDGRGRRPQADRWRSHIGPRKLPPRPVARGRGPGRPLPPARVPARPRLRQAALQRLLARQAQAGAGREPGLRQRRAKARLRRRSLSDAPTEQPLVWSWGVDRS
jgi:hypothetical protein